jgi:hypothetical protein
VEVVHQILHGRTHSAAKLNCTYDESALPTLTLKKRRSDTTGAVRPGHHARMNRS